jgi:hypothetical protein
MPQVCVAGQFEFKDILRAYRIIMVRRRWIWYTLTAIAVLFVGITFVAAITKPSLLPDMVPLSMIGILWGTALWWIPFLVARRQWKKNPNLSGSQDFRFDENGMARKGSTSSTEIKWAGFLSWREDPFQFYLFTGPGSVCFIPRRFLSDAAQIETFRQLLTTQIQGRK